MRFFVSWSGGKDSCLALYRALQTHGKPHALINMMTEDGYRSRSHGLSKTLLTAQAKALSVPIYFYATSWMHYEQTYRSALADLQAQGVGMGVFGDIQVQGDPNWMTHREWADALCASAEMVSYQPLWGDNEAQLLQDFFNAGFVAKIIAVKADCLDSRYLGRILTPDLVSEFEAAGLNPAGERGEYHTVVVDGPIFERSLKVMGGKQVLRDGYWFLDVVLV